MRHDKCVDVIATFLSELSKTGGFTKAAMYGLNPIHQATFRKNANKDK